MIIFKLNLKRVHDKMDSSEMVMLPKAEYEAQQGGVMNPMQEREKINSLMQPQQSYIQSLAKRIVNERPTVQNFTDYNQRLMMFDDIRRRYFNIPTREGQLKKEAEVNELMQKKLQRVIRKEKETPTVMKPKKGYVVKKTKPTPSVRKIPMKDRLRKTSRVQHVRPKRVIEYDYENREPQPPRERNRFDYNG